MRKVLMVASLMLSASAAINAAVLCADPNPRDVLSLNAVGGCTIGGLTFSNFMVDAASGNPNPQIDLFSAYIDQAGLINLGFNPNMSAPPSGGFEDIHFFFTVTGGINQIDLSVGGVNATIIERACSTAIGPNNPICPAEDVLANIIAFSAPPGPNSAVSSMFPATGTVYIYKDIGVSPDRPNSTGGGLTAFTQSFRPQNPVGDVPIPEPISSALCGAGLIAIAVRKKIGSKASRS